MMSEALTWLIPLALIGLMFWAMIRDGRRQRGRTVEEFERDVASARSSMLRAGMLELDKFVANANEKRAAVEYLKDEEQGMTEAGSRGDNAERTSSKR